MKFDYHTHTDFSSDCEIPMETMIKSAIDKGIDNYAITDHYDPGYQDPVYPFDLDFENYWKTICALSQKYKNDITITKGLEIGIMEGQLDIADKAVNRYPFDFVIGSFHCYYEKDLYFQNFDGIDKPAYTIDFYEYVYSCLKKYNNYDVVGHLTILDRYIGEIVDFKPVMPIIEEILKLVIDSGKGIEFNTSHVKYNSPVFLPREEVLKLYLDMGGEILTIGSDAHQLRHQQDQFDNSLEFIQSIGYKYFCTFENRKPTFHKFK